MTGRRFLLREGAAASSIFYFTEMDSRPTQGENISWVTLTRTGRFTDPRYGEFNITRQMLQTMALNWKRDVVGQEIFIDVEHVPTNGVAGKVLALKVKGDRLRARVQWTPFGVSAIKDRGLQYMSAEYHENFSDNEGGGPYGPTLLGAGLTSRPVVKRMEAVRLSEQSAAVLVDPDLGSKLSKELTMDFLKLLADLGLPAAIADKIAAVYKQLSKGQSEEAVVKLGESLIDSGKAIKAEIDAGKTGGEFTLAVDMSGSEGGDAGSGDDDPKTLSAEDIQALVAQGVTDALAAQTLAESTAAQKVEANKALFSKSLTDAGLEQPVVVQLASGVEPLITADLTDAQVVALATSQLSVGQRMTADSKLRELGYGGQRIGHIVPGDTRREVLKLSEEIQKHFKHSTAARQGELLCKDPKDDSPFVKLVLAEFDRVHEAQLHHEAKVLLSADGSVDTASIDNPKGFNREVIRESLSDLNVLDLVLTDIDPTAKLVTQVPYEVRDVAQVINNGVVYEGSGIPFSGVSQLMDEARLEPRKLAMKLSDEVMNFSRASGMNWDAWARSSATNARFSRELLARHICNTLQRNSDAYLAADISAESFNSQLDGSASTIKTTNYPIVRPHQDRDLKGAAVGSAENPITVTLNSNVISEYDGTNAQASGTYYQVTNYNLGYIQFVSELGVAVGPAQTGTNTVSYSHGNANVLKVDLDIATGLTYEQQLNKILQGIGTQKAAMKQNRFAAPNFLLTDEVLHNMATDAEQFIRDRKRDGSDTDSQGNLDRIKAIDTWSTNAPAVDLGDTRILMGQRAVGAYTIQKPFNIGEPIERFDSLGRPTAEKMAYGIEYSAVHVPAPVRYKFTSVLVYSFTGR